MEIITDVKRKSPLIYNITNEVATNFTANGLIAMGATPLMSNYPDEAKEITQHISALVINIGMLTKDKIDAMFIAGKKANQLNIPVVLDPVAVGATTFRRELVERLLKDIKFSAICGNTGEIAVLAGKLARTASPDNILDFNDIHMVKEVANKYETIVISTNQQDVISDGIEHITCNNGHAMLQNITASGCLLTSVIASFLSVTDEKHYFKAAAHATAAYGIAAERAFEPSHGPGTFLNGFLDELYLIDDQSIELYHQLSMVKSVH